MHRWKKQGFIYAPDGSVPWAKHYAHLPTPKVLNNEVIRVYFAALDSNNFGRTTYVDLDIDDPQKVLNVAPEPVLDLGELGTFDDCGTVPSSILEFRGRTYMYYIGHQRTVRVPHMLFGGVAVLQSDGRFLRQSRIPMMDRTEEEPFIRSAAFVMNEDGLLKMWYVSCREWTYTAGQLHYNCAIRLATSTDAVNWTTDPHICISPNAEDEYAVGRPSVIRENGMYYMWYSVRSFPDRYTIGHAESPDGFHWTRKDADWSLTPSDEGWDSEMTCYPFVIDIKGVRHMFYNGNRHGGSGFGYAVLQ
jgi:predicted GH43/DUF377 family glycosyl hydrolase